MKPATWGGREVHQHEPLRNNCARSYMASRGLADAEVMRGAADPTLPGLLLSRATGTSGTLGARARCGSTKNERLEFRDPPGCKDQVSRADFDGDWISWFPLFIERERGSERTETGRESPPRPVRSESSDRRTRAAPVFTEREGSEPSVDREAHTRFPSQVVTARRRRPADVRPPQTRLVKRGDPRVGEGPAMSRLRAAARPRVHLGQRP